MKVGEPIQAPDGLDWRARDEWFDEHCRGKDTISFPVADGYAVYEVRGSTLHHVPVGDAWQVHPALLRGLTKTEVKEMLERERRLAELFSKKS